MEYRQLGTAGVRVSTVGLGGNTFGNACDVQQTAEVVHRALDVGMNHIDTADIYSNGRSEDYVGKALAERRHDVVLATKMGIAMGDGANNAGLSYRRVLASCEGSLKRLATDYIDLFYLHRPDPRTPLAETLRALDDLVRAGKIRYVGLSNFAAWHMTEALWISDRRGYLPPAVTQSQYNALDRSLEKEIVPFCKAFGVGIVPYSPLAGGLLTGKYRKGEPIEPGVRGYNSTGFARQLTDRNFAAVEGLEGFARDHGHTVGELAIAWLLANPSVCSVIAGATKPEQIDANAAAANWALTGDDVKALDALLA